MKVKVKKNVKALPGVIFSACGDIQRRFFSVCEQTDDDRLKVVGKFSSFKKGAALNIDESAVSIYGSGSFAKHFENLEVNEIAEAEVEEALTLIQAVSQLEEGDFTKQGKPNLKVLSKMLDRDVKRAEADEAYKAFIESQDGESIIED